MRRKSKVRRGSKWRERGSRAEGFMRERDKIKKEEREKNEESA